MNPLKELHSLESCASEEGAQAHYDCCEHRPTEGGVAGTRGTETVDAENARLHGRTQIGNEKQHRSINYHRDKPES